MQTTMKVEWLRCSLTMGDWEPKPTINRWTNTSQSFIGAETTFPSLELGVQTSAWGGNSQTRMCYAGPGQYVTPDDSPSNVYQRMFADALLSDTEAAKRRERKQKLIELSRGDVIDLYSRVGTGEKSKLEAHLDSLDDMENRLLDVGMCTPTQAPANLTTYDNDSFPLIAAAQLELGCDRSCL